MNCRLAEAVNSEFQSQFSKRTVGTVAYTVSQATAPTINSIASTVHFACGGAGKSFAIKIAIKSPIPVKNVTIVNGKNIH